MAVIRNSANSVSNDRFGFKVTMDIPDNVSFWEAMKGQTGKNPVYVRSLTYGRAALLMVESEAGFSSMQDAWRNRLEGKDLTLEQQEVSVGQRSVGEYGRILRNGMLTSCLTRIRIYRQSSRIVIPKETMALQFCVRVLM